MVAVNVNTEIKEGQAADYLKRTEVPVMPTILPVVVETAPVKKIRYGVCAIRARDLHVTTISAHYFRDTELKAKHTGITFLPNKILIAAGEGYAEIKYLTAKSFLNSYKPAGIFYFYRLL